MTRSTWITRLWHLSRNSRRKQKGKDKRRGQRFRPRLEALEDRTLLSGGLPYPTPSTGPQLTADFV
jgi:hypothetical protein